MPRFYDDYSNTYLTHDSSNGRKQQRRGWKFRENFKLHYEKNLDEWRRGPNGLAAAQQAVLKSNPNLAPPLPTGWVEEADEATGSNFFYHEESGRRTWVRPGFRPPPTGPMSGPPPSSLYSQPPPRYPPPGMPPSGPGALPSNHQFQRPPSFQRPPPGMPPPQFQRPPPGMPPPPGAPPPQFNRPPPGLPPK